MYFVKFQDTEENDVGVVELPSRYLVGFGPLCFKDKLYFPVYHVKAHELIYREVPDVTEFEVQ